MRRRLLLANLVVVVVVLVVLEVPLALVYSRHEHDSLYAGLQRDAAALAALAGAFVGPASAADLNALAQRFSTQSGVVVSVVDSAGVERTGPNVVGADPAFAPVASRARAGASSRGELSGLVYVAVPVAGDGGGGSQGAVVVARADDAIDRRVHDFWLLLGVLAAVVVGVSLLVTDRVSRWVVEPLRRLDDQAAALGRGDLTARADATAGPPEVVALAATFNEMADQLDTLVGSQRRFVADASHQLRTPLTALRLRLETLEIGDPVATAATRDAALAEAARLTRLVDGLLSLARAERRADRESVDAAAVVRDRQEAWAPLAAEQHVELSVEPRSLVSATALVVPGHLEQILDNLIDNALDASPPGSTVVLRAAPADGRIDIHVVDQGHGLTAEDRQRAFEPFWQSPNGHAVGSTGLGLAIAKQLAVASRGSIRLDQAAGGGIDAVVSFTRDDVVPAP